jgi:uncharacterized protein with ATP-grasp and redox domains
MKTYLDCLPCFVQQALTTVRRFGGDEQAQERVVRAVLKILHEEDFADPPPVIAQRVYPAINACLGTDDPYARLKQDSNRSVLSLLPRFRELIRAARDPFRATVKLVLSGNVIDFGASQSFDLEATVQRMLEGEPARDEIAALQRRLGEGRRVLYLADNAGEIVLDRLLIEELQAAGAEVTLAVRGGPIINDATVEDAAVAGLDQIVRVIAPSVVLPGISLERGDERFREAFDRAEIIISKGQGNYESLDHLTGRYPIFFIFLVKCQMVARDTGLVEGDPVAAFNVAASS